MYVDVRFLKSKFGVERDLLNVAILVLGLLHALTISLGIWLAAKAFDCKHVLVWQVSVIRILQKATVHSCLGLVKRKKDIIGIAFVSEANAPATLIVRETSVQVLFE
jgi:hypothetical protein